MLSSDRPDKVVNHKISMTFSAIQSWSAALCHEAVLGQWYGLEGQKHQPQGRQRCIAWRGAGSCGLSILADCWCSDGKEKMQQDLGRDSGLDLAPLRNLPHCWQMCQASPFHIK